jgi:uncharacterized protein YcaQ
MPTLTLDALRRHAVARTLFKPTTLPRAIERLGFVQADPIRAPARAQDLTRYPRLRIEEDFFVNYGFLPRATQALMHPRTPRHPWPAQRHRQAAEVLAFVRERGVVHPRDVDAHFAHGKVKNWFGGSSNASTQLLDAMHYRGLLRVARRDGGVRLYAARPAAEADVDRDAALDALADVIVGKYAPLPAATLGQLLSHLGIGAPQWRDQRAAVLKRLRARLASTMVDGTAWYWPAGENPASKRHAPDDQVRLLAPFDPIVWDRRRFEMLWGWAYRFEAYTPAPKRVRGYYALPLLWHDRVIGWGNLTLRDGRLDRALGYVDGRAPRDAAFRRALDDELQRIEVFLALGDDDAA